MKKLGVAVVTGSPGARGCNGAWAELYDFDRCELLVIMNGALYFVPAANRNGTARLSGAEEVLDVEAGMKEVDMHFHKLGRPQGYFGDNDVV